MRIKNVLVLLVSFLFFLVGGRKYGTIFLGNEAKKIFTKIEVIKFDLATLERFELEVSELNKLLLAKTTNGLLDKNILTDEQIGENLEDIRKLKDLLKGFNEAKQNTDIENCCNKRFCKLNFGQENQNIQAIKMELKNEEDKMQVNKHSVSSVGRNTPVKDFNFWSK